MTSPVPLDQQPLQEYLALKDSYFFQWAMLPNGQFWRVTMVIWLSWWIVSAPVAAASFAPSHNLWKFLGAGCAGATLGLIFIGLRLFLGWLYIRNRLINPIVFYEETGWYDGQEWHKTEVELAKDKLIATFEIDPNLEKLGRLGIGLIVFLGLAIAATF